MMPLVASLGVELSLVSILPFVLLLLSIAVFPLTASHWWEHNRNKGIVVAILCAPVLLYLAGYIGADGRHRLLESMEEYLSFIMLLTALFVISGGIYVQGSLSGTPLTNTGVLALGALLANVIGTTGA